MSEVRRLRHYKKPRQSFGFGPCLGLSGRIGMFLIALNAVLSIEASAQRRGSSRKKPGGPRMRTFCPVPVPETEHSLIPIVLDVGNRRCDK